MSRSVVWNRSALDDLKRLDPKTAKRIVEAVLRYATTDHGDVKLLKGRTGVYRLRVGKWRVFFTIEGDVITVLEVVLRENAYR